MNGRRVSAAIDEQPSGTSFPCYKAAPISELIPYARNARTHSEAQIAQIAASIREFGFTNPILTDGERGIIAGHGRLLAARKLGMAEVPTIELSHFTSAQKRAYILAEPPRSVRRVGRGPASHRAGRPAG